ncbi:MAG TPA: M23 family metallopeptidase [Thermoanaerobaculia bacterium]|nr:M23 family metallopeptidase [Thermoanaerobaculia bacterium]
MKTVSVLLGVGVIALMAWVAAGPSHAAPIAAVATPAPVVPVMQMRDSGAPRPMIVPVAGVARSAMRDTFDEGRGTHRHEAIDILAPRGTPVIAADDGVVQKLFTSVAGGLTVYEFDPDQRYCYYYAHLDGYAAGLHEGQPLRRGEVIGYVGTSGNASKDTPHLHFALIRLDPDRRWWKGTYVNPYPLLRSQ